MILKILLQKVSKLKPRLEKKLTECMEIQKIDLLHLMEVKKVVVELDERIEIKKEEREDIVKIGV
jgi:hypothetical protein